MQFRPPPPPSHYFPHPPPLSPSRQAPSQCLPGGGYCSQVWATVVVLPSCRQTYTVRSEASRVSSYPSWGYRFSAATRAPIKAWHEAGHSTLSDNNTAPPTRPGDHGRNHALDDCTRRAHNQGLTMSKAESGVLVLNCTVRLVALRQARLQCGCVCAASPATPAAWQPPQ